MKKSPSNAVIQKSGRLTAAKAGEYFPIDGELRKVLPACQDQKNGHWYCATHKEGFQNQFQKDSHIHSGKHTLIWICHEHGPEQP